ncbi:MULTISPECIES: hypothetical protein [unclassified Pantoea]|jgi:hypothetical protein|uniref:hypothetical protein n=1 Tax=unclassified Pantoea TaxID=2630326 RepID=UPI00226B6207|nr:MULTISPECIES: hypothetical protein [unclassified Pantoea]MDF2043257.1 hypothetical protein [Pantoea sp. Cr_R14]MDF2072310.1 hypothetical protein [Pantoea sp. Cr_R13]MDF2080559.1 hypothetical protein [Pantoea sp. Cr_R21]
MVLLNAPDAKQRILKSCNVTGFNKCDLEFIAKHSNSTALEVKKASEFLTGEKVPVTLFVDDLEEANNIVIQARKSKLEATITKSDTATPKPTLQDLVNGIKYRV